MKRGTVPVSVIIPCYCCAGTIERAVQSVVDQVARPFEIFLVDDGSPDQGKTLTKLYELQEQFGDVIRIEVLPIEKNSGPSTARNAAWKQASQPYVAFLDADDSWHAEKLHLQHAWMEEHPDVVVAGHLCAQWHEGIEPETFPMPSQWTIKVVDKRSVLLRNPFSTPSVMLKRDLPFRFAQEQSYAEDYFLWQQVVCAGQQVVRIDLPLAYLHKPAYGVAGLSSHMWAFERAELGNYRQLHAQGCIRGSVTVLLCFYSFAKYLRRVFIMFCRKCRGNNKLSSSFSLGG